MEPSRAAARACIRFRSSKAAFSAWQAAPRSLLASGRGTARQGWPLQHLQSPAACLPAQGAPKRGRGQHTCTEGRKGRSYGRRAAAEASSPAARPPAPLSPAAPSPAAASVQQASHCRRRRRRGKETGPCAEQQQLRSPTVRMIISKASLPIATAAAAASRSSPARQQPQKSFILAKSSPVQPGAASALGAHSRSIMAGRSRAVRGVQAIGPARTWDESAGTRLRRCKRRSFGYLRTRSLPPCHQHRVPAAQLSSQMRARDQDKQRTARDLPCRRELRLLYLPQTNQQPPATQMRQMQGETPLAAHPLVQNGTPQTTKARTQTGPPPRVTRRRVV